MYGHREVLAGVAQEIDQRQLAEPVEVVQQHRARPGREVEEPLQLPADPRHVRGERLAVQEVPLARPARRVADHPRPAADERDRPAAVALQAQQPEDRDQVADVERRPGGVEPDVAGDRATGRQAGRQPGRGGVQDAAPLEVVEEAPRDRSPGRPSQGRTSSRLDPPGGARTVRSRPLCYRAATDADQPRAAPAPSTGAPGPPQGASWLDHRSSRHRRPHRLPEHHPPGGWCWPRRGRRRVQPLLRQPARPRCRAPEPRVRPADARRRPDGQDRAGQARHRSAARSSPTTRSPAR